MLALCAVQAYNVAVLLKPVVSESHGSRQFRKMCQFHVGDLVPHVPFPSNTSNLQASPVVECGMPSTFGSQRNLSDFSQCVTYVGEEPAVSQVQQQLPFKEDAFLQLEETSVLSGGHGKILSQAPFPNNNDASYEAMKPFPQLEPHLVMPELSSSLHVPSALLTLGDTQTALSEGVPVGSSQIGCVSSGENGGHPLWSNAALSAQNLMCYAPPEACAYNAGSFSVPDEQNEPMYVLMSDPGLMECGTLTTGV